MANGMNADWPQPSPLIERWVSALDARRTEGNQWQARCPNPAHKDEKASFGFKQGDNGWVVGNCLGCGDWSGVKSGLVERGLDLSKTERGFRLPTSSPPTTTPQPFALPELPDQALPSKWHDRLLTQDGKKARTFLKKVRGLDTETASKFELGFDGERITIPVQQNGAWVNVRRYLPHASEAEAKAKILSVLGHGAGAPVYPVAVLSGNDLPVLFCEGEFDALLANQEADGRFVAVTGTGGANTPPRTCPRCEGAGSLSRMTLTTQVGAVPRS
jgi:hypothetical protein